MSTDHVSTHPDSPLHGNGIGSEAINLAAIRQEYTKRRAEGRRSSRQPAFSFNRWLHEAIDAQVDEPTAMLVGTVSPEGQPSTRTVLLLKDLHDGKFIFYTNYESRKGTHLAKRIRIFPLSFVWHALERQVHIEGIASKVPAGESDTYFRQRPYKSRIGARISPQSRPLKSRMQLIRNFVAEAARMGRQRSRAPRTLGEDMPSLRIGSSSGKVGQTGFTIAFYIPFNRTEAGRKRGLLLIFPVIVLAQPTNNT